MNPVELVFMSIPIDNAKILITVNLHGVFRINRFKKDVRTYHEGCSVQTILDDLCIPESLLGTILVNDKYSTAGAILSSGDVLILLPFLDGG